MIDYIGISLFLLIFLGFPFHYTISMLRSPDKIEWPSVQVDSERHKCESFIERRLYDALLFNGYYVKTQTSCGKYRIDITLPHQKLAIECDGKAYHSTKQQKAHDRRKDAYLRKHGWKVLRFSGSRINRDMAGIIRKIGDEIRKQEALRR